MKVPLQKMGQFKWDLRELLTWQVSLPLVWIAIVILDKVIVWKAEEHK